jgi:hypothetical protein
VKLINIMPVRNEDWVLGLSLRACLMWCDEVVLLMHACTDRSWQIVRDVIAEHPNRVFVIRKDDTVWRERSDRWTMLQMARARSATHIATLDADEVLTGNLLTMNAGIEIQIRHLIEQLPDNTALHLPWLALPRRIDRYITSGIWGPPQQASIAFKDSSNFYWDTANKDGYDLHRRFPMLLEGETKHAMPLTAQQGGIMHLQFLSERRLRAKQALYQMNEVLRWPFPRPAGMTPHLRKPEDLARMYGRAVYESDPAKCRTEPCPTSWWAAYRDIPWYFDADAEPWQETEVKRLIEIHGRERFAGLDLFGVDLEALRTANEDDAAQPTPPEGT